MTHTMNKSTLDKGLVDLTVNCSSLRNLRPETQGRNLEAGTVPEVMEEYCLLTCSPCFAQPDFLYNPWPPTQGCTGHSGLNPPIAINNQENAHRLSYRLIWYITFLNCGSLLPYDLICIRMKRKKNLANDYNKKNRPLIKESVTFEKPSSSTTLEGPYDRE